MVTNNSGIKSVLGAAPSANLEGEELMMSVQPQATKGLYERSMWSMYLGQHFILLKLPVFKSSLKKTILRFLPKQKRLTHEGKYLFFLRVKLEIFSQCCSFLNSDLLFLLYEHIYVSFLLK